MTLSTAVCLAISGHAASYMLSERLAALPHTTDHFGHVVHCNQWGGPTILPPQDRASQVELEEPSLPPLSIIPTDLACYKEIVNAHLSVQ